MKKEGVWAVIFRRSVIWLAVMTALNLLAHLFAGTGLSWIVLPLAALSLALGMMATARS